MFKRIKKKRLTKKSGTIDETQQELARVEQQLATLGNSSVNFRRTEALRKQKAQLEARISRMTNWGQINNKEFRTQYKKDRRYEKKASQYLKTIGEEVTPENIRKVVSAMQKKKQKNK